MASGTVEAPWKTGLTAKGPQIRIYHFYISQDAIKVKNQAFIDAVFRIAAVEHPTPDQQNISLSQGVLYIVQRNIHATVQNPQDFPFLVPVKGHLISGMVPVHIIVFHREFQSAVLGAIQA